MAHPRSAPCARPEACPLDVVRGRCIVAGSRAPQKLCWVLLAGVPTLEGYVAMYGDRSPPPPPCPACRGPTVRHGSFERHLALDPVRPVPMRLYRAKCNRSSCPVVTITLYPPFVVPYLQVPTEVRDDAVRAHQEGAGSWSRLADRLGYSVAALRRWERAVRARMGDLKAAFLVLLDRYASAHSPSAGRSPPALWTLGDLCAQALDLSSFPRLAIARTVADPLLVALPVWV